MTKVHASNERPKVEVDASHSYGDLVVHERLAFAVAPNEFVCIAGRPAAARQLCLIIWPGY